MNSIICYLGGDQTNTWIQKVEIMKTSIPLEDAKKIFELHNMSISTQIAIMYKNILCISLEFKKKVYICSANAIKK